MKQSTILRTLAVALLGWVGVGAYGIWGFSTEQSGDGWQRPYLLFSISLLLAAIFTTAALWACTHGTERQALRVTGLVVGVVAVASSIAAWAQPLWATLIAVSCILFAVAAPRHLKPGVVVLAASQLVGMVALVGALEAEIGRRDSYGDYPAAFGIGIAVTAAGAILGIAILARLIDSARPETATTVTGKSPATA